MLNKWTNFGFCSPLGFLRPPDLLPYLWNSISWSILTVFGLLFLFLDVNLVLNTSQPLVIPLDASRRHNERNKQNKQIKHYHHPSMAHSRLSISRLVDWPWRPSLGQSLSTFAVDAYYGGRFYFQPLVFAWRINLSNCHIRAHSAHVMVSPAGSWVMCGP